MTGYAADRLSRPPARTEIEALVAEADRRARQLVCDELAGQLARRYREAVATALGPRASDVEQASDVEHASDVKSATDVERERPPPDVDDEGPRIDGRGNERDVDDSSLHETTGSNVPATAWYLYAIIRADDVAEGDLADLSGVEGRPVEFVRADDLAAVTAEVPLQGFRATGEEPDLRPDSWLHKAVRAHERVVEQLCSRATVLPFRFGALYPSRDQTHAVLRDNASDLRAELDRLDGSAEWGVKAQLAEPAAPRDEPSTAADVSGGTEWMLRRHEAAAAREEHRRVRARMAAEIEHALSALARETIVRSSSRPDEPTTFAFDAVYLVSHSADAEFAESLSRIGARFEDEGLRLEVTGPWPPYHFVRMLTEPPVGADTRAPTEPVAVPGGVHLPGPRTQHGAAP